MRSDSASSVRGLRRRRSPEDLPGARLRHDDATALHELVESVQLALGETARYELVVTAGVGVLAAGSKRRSRALAIGFPLIVQAERVELLTLVAGAITDERAARRRMARLTFDRIHEQDPASVFFGPEAAASTMLRKDLCNHLLRDEFWPSVWAEAETSAEPPADVFERMAEFLLELPEARPGSGPLLPASTLARIAGELSGEWQLAVREQWLETHRRHAAARAA